jgi:hypothetical protein
LVSFARHILYLFVCGFSRFNPEWQCWNEVSIFLFSLLVCFSSH